MFVLTTPSASFATNFPSTTTVPVDEIATAFAQAICSLLPCMLSSLHSIPTASSSSSPSAARLSSYRLDLQVPEHLRISVEPPIWLPYASSVTLPGRLALSSFVNTFTPVPTISSIRPNHFPTCFRANCSQKSICYWSRTCSHPAFSWLSRFIAGQLPRGEKRTTNIFGWQTGGIYSQTPLGWSVGHACMVRSIFDLSNGFVS